MNKTKLVRQSFQFIALAVTAFSCNKPDGPKPVEQELITTIRLALTPDTAGATSKIFTYKIENGFNSTTPGTLRADTLFLEANTTYKAAVEVLNEKANPVENVTDEILKESDVHLFLFTATPTNGPGSMEFTNGQKDGQGKPFNLSGTLHTNDAGTGSLRIYLKHEPTNKNGLTSDDAGGETDAEAVFPTWIR